MLARIFPYINFGPGESRRRAARLHTSTLMTTRLRDVLENPSGDRASSPRTLPVTTESLFFVAAILIARQKTAPRRGECFLLPCWRRLPGACVLRFVKRKTSRSLCSRAERENCNYSQIFCEFAFRESTTWRIVSRSGLAAKQLLEMSTLYS